MSLPTKSEIDKYQVNTTNNTISNNQSDLITLNIYIIKTIKMKKVKLILMIPKLNQLIV